MVTLNQGVKKKPWAIILTNLHAEYRTRLPVHEQSKSTMELAILNDTEFLSKCNIMDYSLLVGIDHDNYEMTVGIVGNIKWHDFI